MCRLSVTHSLYGIVLVGSSCFSLLRPGAQERFSRGAAITASRDFNVQFHTNCAVLKNLCSSNEKAVDFKSLLFSGRSVLESNEQ